MRTAKCSLIDQNGICRLMNQKAPDDCGCPHYTPNEIPVCGLCGNPTLDGMLLVVGESAEPICGNCKRKTGTCALCQNSTQCLFLNYDGPLPKVVMKTIQQGNMVAQTQIPNPEVISATCHFCECWNGEECGRAYGTCEKYVASF